LVIPFLGGFALTLGKLIADRKMLSFDESNGVALDMVLIALGALAAFHIEGGGLTATIDAGVGDAFLAMILLYIRSVQRSALSRPHGSTRPVGLWAAVGQIILGMASIVWTVTAF
jgi:hypothetical protein